jgi:DNA repair exonuclease SbcCD ATPase subunit
MDPQTIITFESENVKRLKAVRIEANGRGTVILGGRNAQGKSSVLDSITAAFAGKDAAPDVPVRTGQKRAVITIETQDLVITRKFGASGTTSLEVTNKDGQVYKSPQQVLDGLFSKVAFDPLEFVRDGETTEGRRRQVAKLRELVGIDVGAYKKERGIIFDERTEINRRLKAQEAVVNSLPMSGPTRVDTAAVLAEMAAAEERNREVGRARNEIVKKQGDVKAMIAGASSQSEALQNAERRLAVEQERHNKVRGYLAEMHASVDAVGELIEEAGVIDLEPLVKALREAEAHNAKVTRWQADLLKVKSEYERADAEIQRIDLSIEAIEADMAVIKTKRTECGEKANALNAQAEALASSLPTETDIGTYRQLLAEAETKNAQAAKVEQRKLESAKLDRLQTESDQKTAAINLLDAEYSDALAKANFPIADLGFVDDGVTYRGLPLQQASSAEQLRVGLAIAIAANPKLRVMLIRDASLLDDDSMQIVKDMAAEHGSQVWMEVVSQDAGKCTVIIEDGSILNAP